MTDPEPLGTRAPFRPLDMLANTGVAAAYQAMFFTLRRLVVGRRLTVRVDDGELQLTVTSFGSRLPSGSRLTGRWPAIGRHHDVALEASHIVWGEHELHRARVVLHALHFRGTLRPTELVAAPVELTAEVPAPALDELFRWAAPRLAGDVGPDGVARLHVAKLRGSGYVEVDARLDGSTLWVTPRAVVRRRRWTLPARTPSYRVRVPELPHGLQLTSVEFAPGLVRLTAHVAEWRMAMPLTRLENVIGQLSGVGRPPRLTWPSQSTPRAERRTGRR
ncbi:MAG: hypothetical protein ABW137_16400 [Mycobacterium sp.]